MRVRLAFADGVGDAGASDQGECAESARSLYRWLVGDPELRGRAQVTAPAQTLPGHMGGVLDVVDVVLSNSVGLAGLVVSVATWRGTRRRPPWVRLECGGVKVSVEGSSPEDVAKLLRALDGDSDTATDTDSGGGAGADTGAGPGGRDSDDGRSRHGRRRGGPAEGSRSAG